MDLLGFLGGGGGELITGLTGTIAGAINSKKDRDLQQKLQQQQMEYGREMYALQSADEDRRMEQQNEWNKEAAAQSQEYAKEMFDYTGYENQVKQMKAAGLNPALLNGGSGSAGQAHGATVNPATAMQPMGLQVALQAQQTAAQTALTNAQAEKIRSETTAQKVENLVGIGIELAQKVAEVRKSKKDTEKAQKEIEGIQKNIEQIDEQIDILKKEGLKKEQETKLIEFQNGINNIIKNTTYWDDFRDKGMNFTQAVMEKYYGKLSRDIKTWDKESQQALFDKEILKRLQKDIDLIVKGKLDGLTMSTKEAALKIKQYEREDFELKQDSAFADMLDDLGSDGRYGRVLSNLLRALIDVMGK